MDLTTCFAELHIRFLDGGDFVGASGTSKPPLAECR
jgi:hypothetical protein